MIILWYQLKHSSHKLYIIQDLTYCSKQLLFVVKLLCLILNVTFFPDLQCSQLSLEYHFKALSTISLPSSSLGSLSLLWRLMGTLTGTSQQHYPSCWFILISTQFPVFSIHIHASQIRTWDFVKVQILIHHVLGQEGNPLSCISNKLWMISLTLSMGHSVWKDHTTWLSYYLPSWACLSPKDIILQNDLLPPLPACSPELLLP